MSCEERGTCLIATTSAESCSHGSYAPVCTSARAPDSVARYGGQAAVGGIRSRRRCGSTSCRGDVTRSVSSIFVAIVAAFAGRRRFRVGRRRRRIAILTFVLARLDRLTMRAPSSPTRPVGFHGGDRSSHEGLPAIATIATHHAVLSCASGLPDRGGIGLRGARVWIATAHPRARGPQQPTRQDRRRTLRARSRACRSPSAFAPRVLGEHTSFAAALTFLGGCSSWQSCSICFQCRLDG